MFKKVIALGLMLVMVFSLAACGNTASLEKKIDDLQTRIEEQDKKIEELEGDNKALQDKIDELKIKNKDLQDKIDLSELPEYKLAAKEELENYMEEKDRENYMFYDWCFDMEFVLVYAYDAIDEAENKAEVDLIVADAKQEMDEVPQLEKHVKEGEFYNLEEAYENGWLTHDDLETLAYYYNNRGSNSELELEYPLRNPETDHAGFLDDETINKIKVTYLLDWLDVYFYTTDNIRISSYYGIYGDCIALDVVDGIGAYDVKPAEDLIVDGVLFIEGGMAIWKAND